MKKIILALLLMMASATVFADVGLFFDGTDKYAKTGVIQNTFPEIPLYKCANFKSCEQLLPGNSRIAVVYSDLKKMAELAAKLKNRVASSAFVHTTRGRGFKIVVMDIMDTEGRGYVLLQVHSFKKKTTSAQNQAIAQALVTEIDLSYARAGL